MLKWNCQSPSAVRTQSRGVASTGLLAVRRVAQRSMNLKFTALMHHIDIGLLRQSYLKLKRNAASGIDGVDWVGYGERLDERLTLLHRRVQQGSYRAQPARRVYIPKTDGSQRPLSILCIEDKIVQQAVVEVLQAIYETDFIDFSYGFRPGRGQHDALDALQVALYRKQMHCLVSLITACQVFVLRSTLVKHVCLSLVGTLRSDVQKKGRVNQRRLIFSGLHTIATAREKNGWIKVERKTITKRMRVQLKVIKTELRRRMHQPIEETGRWITQVIRDHMAYYAVPGNGASVASFVYRVEWLWLRSLCRRSQRRRMNWGRFRKIAGRYVPRVRIMHPQPLHRFDAKYTREEPSALVAPAGICAGVPGDRYPLPRPFIGLAGMT